MIHVPAARTRAAARVATLALAALAVQACAFGARAAQQIDGAQLMRDLTALAHDSLGGRAPDSPGSRMARAYLTSRIETLGLEVEADTFPVARAGGEVDGVNLYARVEGTERSDRFIVLTAHYDHMGVVDGAIFNGADDNASGVSALLQIAEALVREPPRHSVFVVFLDAEEGGLRGARRWVSQPPVPLDDVILNVNLDMVSRTEGELWAVGTNPYPALRPIVESVDPEPPVFLRFGHDTEADRGSDNWVNASDHAAFHREGIPFLYFGVSDHPDYHRPTDDADHVDAVVFTAVVETLWRALEALDRAHQGVRLVS